MRYRALLASSSYLVPAGVQGVFGFLVVAVIARQLGTPGLANWGIQQLVYQVLTLALALGLPALVAAQSVTVDSSPEQADRYGVAMGTITLGSTLAVAVLLARDALAGDSIWPFVAAVAGVNALVQTVTARLRGQERHLTNSALLTVTWTLGYGGGITAVLLTNSLLGYWLGLLAGTAAVLSASLITVSRTRLRCPHRDDIGFLAAGVLALPHSMGNYLMVGVLRPIAGLAAGPGGIAAVTVASQFAQIATVLHQAYWSSHMPIAIRAHTETSGRSLRRLRTRSTATMLGIWALLAALAPIAVPLIAGTETTASMVVISALLCGVPAASIAYDLYAAMLWRAARTSVLSSITVVGLLLTVALALLGASSGLAALPIALLLARLVQGSLVRRAVRS